MSIWCSFQAGWFINQKWPVELVITIAQKDCSAAVDQCLQVIARLGSGSSRSNSWNAFGEVGFAALNGNNQICAFCVNESQVQALIRQVRDR